MRTGKLNHARREMHIARMNENNMRNQLRARVDHLKTENAELRRLITGVAIPSLALYARTDKAPKVAIQWLQEAVK